MSRRTGILLAILGITLVLIGGVFVGNLFRRSLAPPPASSPPPPQTEKVVVATRDLPLGAVLSAWDVSEIEVPLGLAPRGVLRQVSEAVGRLAKVALVEGEMVMQHHLANPTNISHDLAFVIGDDKVLMAFPAKDLMSQLNILQRGDLVDILVSIEQEVEPVVSGPVVEGTPQPETRLFTFDALQRIVISAVLVEIIQTGRGGSSPGAGVSGVTGQQGTPQPTPTPMLGQVETVAFLLALDPQDALVLKHLKDAGGIIDIVLRAPTSNQLFELVPVLSEYLIDRFELEITR